MKALFGIGFFLGYLGLVLGLVFLKIWLIGSLLVSGVKAISDKCDYTYPIESVGFSGNWFCPSGAK